jgi:O-antigen biosynthesis protein
VRERASGADRLVGARVIDRAFIEAITGRTFESDRAAARHFLNDGKADYPPHPLIDPDLLPTWVSQPLDRGKPGPLLRYLRGEGAVRRLGPLFDSAAVAASEDERAEHPGGALGLFLQTADESTHLPGHPEHTWGRARHALLDRARLIWSQARHAGSRVHYTWDDEAEERWREEWATAELPVGEPRCPLVSVVIPVRNRPEAVAAAIESVIAQTLESWELVVVDDGSTDHTPQVLEEWAARDRRIRIVRQEWSGVSAARNRGLEQASGRYLAFLDSDNRWRPDFLRLTLAAMQGKGLRAAYAAMALHEDDRTLYRAHPYSYEDLLVRNYVDPNVLVVERDLALEVGGFDEEIRRWVDHDFALRLGRRTTLELLPFVAVDYDASQSATGRITTSESLHYQYVVLGRQWVDWTEVANGIDKRVPDRLSVIVPSQGDARLTTQAVRSVLDHPEVDIEVVVVDNGAPAKFGISIAAAFLDDGRVQYVRLPRNLLPAVGFNYGFAHSTGEYAAILSPRAAVRPGWWAPLARHLSDPGVLGVQPLLLDENDTILSAGLVFPADDAAPCAFMEGHPPEDAARIRDLFFHAISADAMVMRAADLAALRGFDPVFPSRLHDADLCLRAGELREGRFVLEPASRVNVRRIADTKPTRDTETRRQLIGRWRGRLPAAETRRWRDAGFAVAHFENEGVPLPGPRPLVVRPRQSTGNGETPALRWGLVIAAPGGAGGDAWSDTHFAGSLARSLRAMGQDVVTHRRGAVLGPASRFDDVVVALRGLEPAEPIPGKVNVLWVISHPDDVPAEELTGFDLVYAASEPWARRMSAKSGRPVQALLQATDVRLPDSDRAPAAAWRPVFVGSTNARRARHVVLDAVAAGVELDVHGQGWAGTPAEPFWRSPYVPNRDLMPLYRRHGLVIADQGEDMAREGFLANRLFDAVASGVPVVSDPVSGLEMFDGAVQTYSSLEELRFLCSASGRDRFPAHDEMMVIADRIAAEHSFDRRAAELLEAVTVRRPT